MLQDSLLAAGPEPKMKDSVMCRGQNAFRVVPFEGPEAGLMGPCIKVHQLLLRQDASGKGHSSRG